jgi:MoaA/NifB/PqqE/SkfB family radical SAM enzyme
MSGRADIKTGFTCNNNCIHCVIGGDEEKAKLNKLCTNRTTKDYINEIIESRNRGFDRITITGGEPTIRKDLPIICRFAKQMNMVVSIQSNGRLFAYETFVDDIAPYVDNAIIAIHSHSEENHDKITRAKGSFKQTIQGVKNLAKAGVKVHGKTVITEFNYRDLPKILDVMYSLGIRYANIAFPHANGNSWKYFDTIVPYYRDIQPYIEKCIEKYPRGHEFYLEFEQILPCALSKDYHRSYFTDFFMENAAELKPVHGRTIDWTKERREIKSKAPFVKNVYMMMFVKVFGRNILKNAVFRNSLQ